MTDFPKTEKTRQMSPSLVYERQYSFTGAWWSEARRNMHGRESRAKIAISLDTVSPDDVRGFTDVIVALYTLHSVVCAVRLWMRILRGFFFGRRERLKTVAFKLG